MWNCGLLKNAGKSRFRSPQARITNFAARVLLLHALLNNVLHFQRVWHAQECRRAETKWTTFGIRRKADAVALGIRISKRWGKVCGHCFDCLLLLLRQSAG